MPRPVRDPAVKVKPLTPVGVAPPVHARLTRVKEQIESQKQRGVTFSEVIEIMLDRLAALEDA
jgi:hypothetical protein